MREISEKELIHERLGEVFLTSLSQYDTARRMEVLIDEFLTNEMLAGKRVLEVGTGLGFFAERLVKRGAVVTAVDIGPTMLAVAKQRAGCECLCVDALALQAYFGAESFDIVLSSECIEHTPSPDEALRQMAAVLKSGGHLALSTPNRIWYPAVALATALRARPFDGLEHFSTFGSIRRALRVCGMQVIRESGLHLFPFQFGMYRLSTWCDHRLQIFRNLMINLCVLARKD